MAHFVGSKGANLVGLNVFQPTFTIVQTVCSHSFQFLLSQCPQTNNNGNTVAWAYTILIHVQNISAQEDIDYCFTSHQDYTSQLMFHWSIWRVPQQAF